ncbi:MYB86 [Hepatospora eriocheir]|uniref:MYB86 n=1 Tax=Hepatospora eriocheir TaxID=1081669 RepID=A0A1X0Q6Y9_9MICR|nr:MYB86 [Hepatospora eriocheir]
MKVKQENGNSPFKSATNSTNLFNRERIIFNRERKENLNNKEITNLSYGSSELQKFSKLADVCDYELTKRVENFNVNRISINSILKYQNKQPVHNDEELLYSNTIDNISNNDSKICNCFAEQLNRGRWSKEEDISLLRFIKNYGTDNWSFIAAKMVTRNAKQCRERYFNQLNPSLNKNPFTKSEIDLIIKSQRELGNKWTQIAERLTNRSENDVKNFYYGIKKNKNRKK